MKKQIEKEIVIAGTGPHKEMLMARLEELKKENDKANQYLQQSDQERAKVVQEVLVRNGRILELTEMLKAE